MNCAERDHSPSPISRRFCEAEGASHADSYARKEVVSNSAFGLCGVYHSCWTSRKALCEWSKRLLKKILVLPG
jgi:hypothetical protein